MWRITFVQFPNGRWWKRSGPSRLDFYPPGNWYEDGSESRDTFWPTHNQWEKAAIPAIHVNIIQVLWLMMTQILPYYSDVQYP